MTSADTPLDTSRRVSGQPCAAVSSQTMASSVRPPPSPAVFFRPVDPDEAGLAEGLPQLCARLARLRPGRVVRAAEAPGDLRDGLPQSLMLNGLREVHVVST